MVLVMFGWIIFAFDDMQTALALKGAPVISAAALYEWRDFAPLLIIAAAGCTGAVKKYYWENERIPEWVKRLSTIPLFVAAVFFIVSGSYNPFLYFRF